MRRFIEWLKSHFRKEINPYTISDKVVFRNVDKTITVCVRSDAPSMMFKLKQALKELGKVTEESSQEERVEAARFFARAVFGNDGDKLLEFYDDPDAVISAVGLYFNKRLKVKITKAQKK